MLASSAGDRRLLPGDAGPHDPDDGFDDLLERGRLQRADLRHYQRTIGGE
jgi:hypothetical protein